MKTIAFILIPDLARGANIDTIIFRLRGLAEMPWALQSGSSRSHARFIDISRGVGMLISGGDVETSVKTTTIWRRTQVRII
jgi:hypothetical protein